MVAGSTPFRTWPADRIRLPTTLTNTVNRKWLILATNQLTGEIPPELGNLANLAVLGLDGNQLTGCVPSSLSGRLNMDNSDLGDIQFCP